MTQPFDENDVLYRFVPTEEEQKGYRAEEYAIVRNQENFFGFCLWVRDERGWQVGYHGERVVISRLLHEQDELTRALGEKEHQQDVFIALANRLTEQAQCSNVAAGQELGKLHQQVTNLEGTLAHVNSVLAKVAAERDHYRTVLSEQYPKALPLAEATEHPHCTGEAIADGNGLGADGCIYAGDPAHCGICRLTAERDLYQKVLESYATAYMLNIAAAARAALEQGAKIRGES